MSRATDMDVTPAVASAARTSGSVATMMLTVLILANSEIGIASGFAFSLLVLMDGLAIAGWVNCHLNARRRIKAHA